MPIHPRLCSLICPSFVPLSCLQVHGIALWFDCTFPGSQRKVVLDTSPLEPLTHWYQVRCLLRAPLAAGVGHILGGKALFEANEARGYNVHVTLTNTNTGVTHENTVVTQCALHHFQYTTQSSQTAYAYPQQPASGEAVN
jgi:histone-arginine methyltransferase CARM1